MLTPEQGPEPAHMYFSHLSLQSQAVTHKLQLLAQHYGDRIAGGR